MTTTYRTTFHRDHTVTVWDCWWRPKSALLAPPRSGVETVW